ncbi:MAG: hypothetical protein WBM07_19030 [Chitinivibrionales bacterium]
MDGQYTVSTDKKEKIKLDSRIIRADWLSGIAYGGAYAKLEVKTVFVAEGSTIEIKGISSQGKAPDKISGKVFNNTFAGELLIPEKIKPGADIWFEAKLPKHGLTMESGTSIPTRPPIVATKIAWDRAEVHREDIVTMQVEFQDIPDHADASVIVYEHNPNSYDMRVVSIPVEIMGSAINLQWQFMYPDSTALIPTETELKKVNKHYCPPQYYFMVTVDGTRIGENRESGLLAFREKLNLQLFDAWGVPVNKGDFILKFADGTQKKYTSDESGFIKNDTIPPGKFFVEYVKKE